MQPPLSCLWPCTRSVPLTDKALTPTFYRQSLVHASRHSSDISSSRKPPLIASSPPPWTPCELLPLAMAGSPAQSSCPSFPGGFSPLGVGVAHAGPHASRVIDSYRRSPVFVEHSGFIESGKKAEREGRHCVHGTDRLF